MSIKLIEKVAMSVSGAPKAEFAMDPAKLRQLGSQTFEVLEKCLKKSQSDPVRPSSLVPGDLAKAFSKTPPVTARANFADILEDVENKIFPGVTNWQHAHFMAYYPAASSIPAVLSEAVIAAIGSVGLYWQACPILTELEVVVMDWLADMLHAPIDSPFRHSSGKGGGIIQNTAGEAMATIMIAARVNKQTKLLRDKLGLGPDEKLTEEQREETYYADSSKLVVYVGDQSHFSAFKAIRAAGMQCRKIKSEMLPDTGNYGIAKDQVLEAMRVDRENGLIPAGLILCHGFTNTCGYDRLSDFANFFEEHEVWVHCDAAYAGTSLILEDMKERSLILQDACTSFNLNGSKAFLCGFDTAFLFVRDRTQLVDTFSATGNYLEANEDTLYSPDFKDWAIPLGRRFRSLRVWMVIEYFGVDGLRKYLQDGRDQADWLRAQIDSVDYLSQPVKTDLKLVCFDAKTPENTQKLIEEMSRLKCDGEDFFVLPSKLNGDPMVRVALGGANTTMKDVEMFWSLLLSACANCGLTN